MDFIWVVTAFVVAYLIHVDGKVGGPYFAFSQLVFGYPELRQQYTGRSVSLALLRRAVYLFVGGLILGLLGRGLAEALGAGILSVVLLIWPVLFVGLPPQHRRSTIIILYAALVLMAAGLSTVGWYTADWFGSAQALAAYLADHAVGIVIGLVVSAFGAGAAGWITKG